MFIRFCGKVFTEQSPSDSPSIADVFSDRYQATAAVHRGTAQQRVYKLQYVVYHVLTPENIQLYKKTKIKCSLTQIWFCSFLVRHTSQY
jgi:hypothetical protein